MSQFNHRALLFGFFAVASTFNAVHAAPKAKPKPKTATKTVVKPKAPQQNILGMVPMSGVEGKIGQTYTVGGDSPLNFTLDSAEYTLERINIGETATAPNKDEKLLVLRYTVHNPNKVERQYDWATLNFTAVDAMNENREYIQAAGSKQSGQDLSTHLKPAQKVEAYTAIKVPAKGVIPKLIVKPSDGGGVIRYDLRTVVKTLVAPFTENGTTALEEINAQRDTYYPLTDLDVKLIGTSYANKLGDVEREEEQRFFVATVSMRNGTTTDKNYDWATITPQLFDVDGEEVAWPQAMLKTTRNETADGTLKPGAEYTVRYYFMLPKNVNAKTLKLQEGESHIYSFDVSNTN
jgi:hypothetical protein